MQNSGVEMEQVSEMANLINKAGPVAVILSVFLILFLIIVMALLKGFMSSQKQLQEQNESLTNTMIMQLEELKKSQAEIKADTRKNYDEKSMVSIFVKLNKTFKMDCKHYAETVQCDRIGIYVFHNGAHSSHGIPFIKTSCISEWIKRGSGISTHLTDSNSVPLTVFDDVIERLYSYGFVIVRNDVEDSKENEINEFSISSSSFYLDRDKAKVAIFVGIYDSVENIMAFIMTEYIDRIDNEEIEHCMEQLREFSSKIKPTLEFSDYNATREDEA